MMNFGEKIKKYRNDNNLTQEDLASKLHVSRAAVSKYETGRAYPSMDIMLEIAKMLEVSIDELLSKEEITKEAIETNNINKRNKIVIIIVLIVVGIALIISSIAIITSINTHNKLSDDISKEVDNLEYLGEIGMLSDSLEEMPTIEGIINKEYFGVYYIYENDMKINVSNNISNILIRYGDNFKASMDVVIHTNKKYISTYNLYYNKDTKEYSFNSTTVSQTIGALVGYTNSTNANGKEYEYEYNIITIDELLETKIYEYDMNFNIIKEAILLDDDYIVDENLLFLVIEEKFKDKDGKEYYNRKIVYSDEINISYAYLIKKANQYGFCDKIITIKKA